MGWTVFVYSQIPPGWPHVALNMIWMGGLLFPFGFWLRRRWESVLGALVLASCSVLLCTIGNLSASWSEIGASIIGLSMGAACSLWVARSLIRAHGRDGRAGFAGCMQGDDPHAP
jgi:hypothetical protein